MSTKHASKTLLVLTVVLGARPAALATLATESPSRTTNSCEILRP